MWRSIRLERSPISSAPGARSQWELGRAGDGRDQSPGLLSVGERRLRRDLVLRDDGFGPREIFQQALAGQDKEVIAELRVLEVDLEQLFIADSQDAAILDTFDRRGPAVVERGETKLGQHTPRREFDDDFDDPEFAGNGQQHFVW